MNRIKNLKYDPKHADKRQRAYNHLEYLDRVISMETAKKIVAYEKKQYGKPVTIEIIEVQKATKNKGEKHDSNER